MCVDRMAGGKPLHLIGLFLTPHVSHRFIFYFLIFCPLIISVQSTSSFIIFIRFVTFLVRSSSVFRLFFSLRVIRRALPVAYKFRH